MPSKPDTQVDRAVRLYVRTVQTHQVSLARMDRLVSRIKRMTLRERDEYYKRTSAINLELDSQHRLAWDARVRTEELSDWGWLAQ